MAHLNEYTLKLKREGDATKPNRLQYQAALRYVDDAEKRAKDVDDIGGFNPNVAEKAKGITAGSKREAFVNERLDEQLKLAGAPEGINHQTIRQIRAKGMLSDFTAPSATLSSPATKAPQAPGPAGKKTVKMKAPNGHLKDVPEDQVAHYESLGAKRVK